jgi:cytochrome bd-type quinol oxidase subunit 1
MDIAPILTALESASLSKSIRNSLYAYPLIEAAHVIAGTLVFGTVAVVDLRLLGVASGHRPFTTLAAEILKWTWVAFALAVVTGSLMFITNASGYSANRIFQLKMLALLLAGLNMAVFQVLSSTSIHLWDTRPMAPPSGRIAATLSLCLWVGVIVMGRLIGFTMDSANDVQPPPVGADFDTFLSGGSAPVPPARALPSK